MAFENLVAKSVGAIKAAAEKASESEKGVVEFITSIGKTITELVEAKDKFEGKITYYENEYKEVKTRMEEKLAYYEAELKKTREKAALLVGGMVVLQVVTLVCVIVLMRKT